MQYQIDSTNIVILSRSNKKDTIAVIKSLKVLYRNGQISPQARSSANNTTKKCRLNDNDIFSISYLERPHSTIYHHCNVWFIFNTSIF